MWPSHGTISRRGHSQALQVLSLTAWHELNPRCTVWAWVLSCELRHEHCSHSLSQIHCRLHLLPEPLARSKTSSFPPGLVLPSIHSVPSAQNLGLSASQTEGLGDSSSLGKCLQIPPIPFLSSAHSMTASQRQDLPVPTGNWKESWGKTIYKGI